MTIAITGGTGFVGQAVLDEALRQGVQVRALTRREQPEREGVTWVRGDLHAETALEELAAGAKAMLHIAGVVNAPDAEGFRAGNIVGTENVVSAARSAGAARFIHVSSLAAREPGLSQYGHSKRLSEEAVQTSGLDWTIVRPPAIYGPRDTEIFELFKSARWGMVPMPPAGRASIIHVTDLARLLLKLSQPLSETSNRIFEPDDGQEGGWTHGELAQAIGEAVGRKVWAPHVPRGLLFSAARLDRLLRGDKAKLTPDRASYMAHPDWTSAPGQQVPADLWQPEIPTKQGLAATAQWYRQQGWL
ncbi:NAD(P)-dependent oxidoreductase [Aurantiacibacter sp. MUD11]|uniref:NAD-dependent epimerase/dehydratase family protein n=1 Tax=Aurantiacibacter sp. MUD11 TaxID=3003265 RepID=UPI0022AA820D|nr:NAD(P)-dependent oxidoreductase [Aurantiacibacter sp. MUD11]WAT19031.1 NAD(P)-dependent oxidoreductase [Aurantiacibacter sp. MUD11]